MLKSFISQQTEALGLLSLLLVVEVLVLSLCLSADSCERWLPVHMDLKPNSEPGNLTALKPQHSSSANPAARRPMTSLSEEWTGITVVCGKWPVRPKEGRLHLAGSSSERRQELRGPPGTGSEFGFRVILPVFGGIFRLQLKWGGCVAQEDGFHWVKTSFLAVKRELSHVGTSECKLYYTSNSSRWNSALSFSELIVVSLWRRSND